MSIWDWFFGTKKEEDIGEIQPSEVKKVPDISEPVTSLVALIKKYPKRFELKSHSGWPHKFEIEITYLLIDKSGGRNFSFSYKRWKSMVGGCGGACETWVERYSGDLFTPDEYKLIADTFQLIFEQEHNRRIKIIKYLQVRKERAKVAKRIELTAYYQGELLK